MYNLVFIKSVQLKELVLLVDTYISISWYDIDKAYTHVYHLCLLLGLFEPLTWKELPEVILTFQNNFDSNTPCKLI